MDAVRGGSPVEAVNVPCWDCVMAICSERGQRLLYVLDSSLTEEQCEKAMEAWFLVFHDRRHEWKETF